MNFANLQLLWLLAVLPPALVGFYWWAWRHRQQLLTQFIQARLLPGLITGVSPTRQKIRMGCIVLAVVLLIFTVARPQWGFTIEESKQIGLDIVVAVDTSKSMLAEDIAPNRLQRAKLAALDLMQQARADRLGLVAFAGDAFLQCPLTIDDTAFRQSVDALDVNTVAHGGTSLSSAINTALTAFKEGDNYKVLVLFTDGEDNDTGDAGALEAAQSAASDGLIIFTVGVGTAEGELLRVTDASGQSDYVRDEQGNVVKSHLNEPLLKAIAAATKGGFYLPLRGAGTIDALYTKGLAPLPKSEQGVRVTRQYNERYQWFLLPAIMLLLVEMLLPERKRRRAEAASGSPAPALRAAAIVAILLASVMAVRASPSEAQKDYQSGNYDAALKEYQHELEKKADDPRLHYDAGVSAYRDKQYNEAAKQFDQATGAQDLKLQEGAYYNLGNALFRSGEENQDADKKKQSWQDAVKEFQNTLTLNPADVDAKHNLEFVRKKLEELQKQQQQQQNQNQQNQQNQDQNQNQKQQQQSQQQSQQQQSQNQQQNQSQQQSQNQQGQEQNQKQNGQEGQQAQQKQAQQDQQGQEKQKQEQAKASESQQKPEEQGEQQEAEAQQRGQMTSQEARRLLDTEKGDEQILQWNAGKQKPEDNNRPVKDW